MPTYLTHRIAAAMVNDKLADKTIKNEKAFYLGSQGPDMLFFRNFYPWKNSETSFRLGLSMHNSKVRELFAHGLEFVRNYKGEGSDELASYIAGMIVHYAIDKNAHPFVYGKSGRDSALHNRIEFMWDFIAAKQVLGKRADEYDFKSEILYAPLGKGIQSWYCNAAKEIYDTVVNSKMVLQAQKHFAFAKKALNNINVFARAALWFASSLLKFDTHSLIYPKEENYTLFTKEEYAHMKALIQKGANEAVVMLKFAFRYFESNEPTKLPEWFGDTDFSGSKAE